MMKGEKVVIKKILRISSNFTIYSQAPEITYFSQIKNKYPQLNNTKGTYCRNLGIYFIK